MSSKFVRLVIALFIVGIVSYVFYLNPQSTTVNLRSDSTWSAPLALVLISAFSLGAIFVGLLAVFFAARQKIAEWGLKREIRARDEQQQLLVEGREALAAGSTKQAISLFQKAVGKQHSHTLGRMLLVEAALEKGDLATAGEYLDSARQEERQNLEYLFLGAKLAEKKQNFVAAFDNVSLALKKQSDNQFALERIVRYSVELSRFEEAKKFQQQRIRLARGDDRETLLNELAAIEIKLALQASSTEEKRDALKEVLKRHKSFAPAYLELGAIEKEQANLDEASKLWGQGYKSSGSTIFLRLLANTWTSVGEPEKAVKLVRGALQSHSSNPEAKLLLVELLLSVGMLDEAKAELSSAAESMNESTKRKKRFLEAIAAERSGDTRKALELLKSLSEIELELSEERDSLKMNGSSSSWVNKALIKSALEKAPSPVLSTP